MLMLHLSRLILQFCLLHLSQERDFKKYFNIIAFWLALKAAVCFVSGLKPPFSVVPTELLFQGRKSATQEGFA